MAAVPTLLSTPIAAIKGSDAVVLVVLVLFAWWGARRGALRQLLSLAVLLASFFAAGRLAPHLVPSVAKISDLEADERLAAAWAGTLFGLLVAGAIVLRFVETRLAAPAPDRRGRFVGGSLGLLNGLFIVVVASYAVLGAAEGDAPPLLSRSEGTAAAEASQPPLIRRMQGSVAAEALTGGAALITPWLRLPPWVQARMERVDEQLGP